MRLRAHHMLNVTEFGTVVASEAIAHSVAYPGNRVVVKSSVRSVLEVV